jgi:hypothetical protein
MLPKIVSFITLSFCGITNKLCYNELKNEQAQNANYTHPNRPPHSVDYTCDGTVERCIGIGIIGVSDRRDQDIGNVGCDRRDQDIGNVGCDRRDQDIGNVGCDRRDQDNGNVGCDRRDQDNGNVGDFTRGFLRAKRIRPRKT